LNNRLPYNRRGSSLPSLPFTTSRAVIRMPPYTPYSLFVLQPARRTLPDTSIPFVTPPRRRRYPRLPHHVSVTPTLTPHTKSTGTHCRRATPSPAALVWANAMDEAEHTATSAGDIPATPFYLPPIRLPPLCLHISRAASLFSCRHITGGHGCGRASVPPLRLPRWTLV